MLETTAAAIAEITGGSLVGGADPDLTVTGAARVDSRLIQPGDLFIAFAGEHADGHDFAAAAHRSGAVLSLLTREADVPGILVTDPLEAITALATAMLTRARAENDRLTVIGITGSSGKTSTKDLLNAILSPVAETIAPAGSRNNELGLPLTILELTANTRFLVLEMGARGIGHIRHLTEIARPDISVVLNVGSAHVGEFGSVDNIRIAKQELVEALTEDGTAVLNLDDPRVAQMASASAGRVIGTGFAADAEVTAENLRVDDAARPAFTLITPAGSAEVQLQLTGEHHVSNALQAAAAALAAGVDGEQIASGLRSATSRSHGRMQVNEVDRGITIINDAYNANPDSMRTALKALAHLGRTRRTIAVLGEMLELGEDSIRLHDEVGRLAVRLNITHLIAVGDGARAIHNGAHLEGSFGGESQWVDSIQSARDVLETMMQPGDVVLLKSSNGVGLARLGDQLVQDLTTSTRENHA